MAAFASSRRLFASTVRCAFSRTAPTVGMRMAARIPMIAMTVSSSMRVKAAGCARRGNDIMTRASGARNRASRRKPGRTRQAFAN